MKKNLPLILVIFTINFLFSQYIDVQFASFSYTIGGSYGSCVKFKKAEYAFSQFNECSCAWAANDSSYPNCYDLFYDPQTKIIKYNLSEGGEYIYRNFSNDYTCHIYEEETGPLECTEIDHELQCSQNSECNWVEDIAWGYCGNLNPTWNNGGQFCNDPSVSTDQCYTYTCYGGYYGEWNTCCGGDPYIIDNNSYCEEVSYIPGDANGDGSLNVSDIVLIVDLILNSEYDEYSDLNQDGILNVIDVVELVSIILNN